LVSGSEDIGTPYELFHPTRNYSGYSFNFLWPSGQRFTMKEFIRDTRLKHWFVQNYDLVGCNYFTCSNVNEIEHIDIIKKVTPIPIGMDFHTLSEKIKKIHSHLIPKFVCAQIHDVFSISKKDFKDKPLIVNTAFDCNFGAESTGIRNRTRGNLCRHLEAALERNDKHFISPDVLQTNQVIDKNRKLSFFDSLWGEGNIKSKFKESGLRKKKKIFWKNAAISTFSFAPPGYGMDTHRFWEILQMHTVPIVISSPLDILYKQFPVIIVKDWEEVFIDGALQKFKDNIIEKFGEHPFKDDIIMTKLSMNYWINLVHQRNQL
jgi:hypothetical protein